MARQPGDTLGRYTIQAMLGEGGMGEVYRAYDPRLMRHVALKVLRADVTGSGGGSEGTARMLREARAAAALDHPNAVAIFDVGDEDGTAYLAMELIEGRSLRAFVGDASVPLARRVEWLLDIARALSAAHKRGLVHRDIKPENVMVREDGVLKVLDFGIARRAAGVTSALATTTPVMALAATTPEGIATITQDNALVGTPLYMAPEQLKGEPLDGRVDQFAWGVLAYELLTGRHPWDVEQHAFRVVAAILTLAPKPPSAIAPEVPREVESVVLRALEKSPDARFSSMDELIAALARGAGATLRPAAMPARSYGRAIAGATIAVAAAIAIAFALRKPASPPPAAASSSPSAAQAPLPIAALPSPSSAKPEANAAFSAAMQAFHDGSGPLWAENLARAAEVDPDLGAAHLRLAWTMQSSSPAAAREHFTRATALRSTLTDRDRDLLDAAAPYFQREPADLVETLRRIEIVVEKRPRDAELLFFLAGARSDRGDFRGAVSANARALEVDPTFAMAAAFKGAYEAYTGDYAAARATFARCLDATPGATLCAYFRATIERLDGECEAMGADARRMIAVHPRGATAYAMLAEAELAQGRVGSAREALAQQAERVGDARRAHRERWSELRLAEIAGDFDGAERAARALESLQAGREDEAAHGAIAAALVGIYDETAQRARAAEVAKEFLARRGAWMPNPRGEDYAVADDVRPLMLAAELRGGALAPDDFEKQRADWLGAWTETLAPAYRFTVWQRGVAAVAETKDEAERAIAMLASYGPPREYGPITLASVDLGRVQLRAGRIDDAVLTLSRATKSCAALEDPIAHTRAFALLGEALEAKRDTQGACAAYRVVLDRWGASKKSVTARNAATRVRALACK